MIADDLDRPSLKSRSSREDRPGDSRRKKQASCASKANAGIRSVPRQGLSVCSRPGYRRGH